MSRNYPSFFLRQILPFLADAIPEELECFDPRLFVISTLQTSLETTSLDEFSAKLNQVCHELTHTLDGLTVSAWTRHHPPLDFEYYIEKNGYIKKMVFEETGCKSFVVTICVIPDKISAPRTISVHMKFSHINQHYEHHLVNMIESYVHSWLPGIRPLCARLVGVYITDMDLRRRNYVCTCLGPFYLFTVAPRVGNVVFHY